MSIRVLKAKAQSRRLVTEKNSVAKLPVNLYYSRNSGLCCPTRHHQPKPSGGIYIEKKPAPQKSYRNYNNLNPKDPVAIGLFTQKELFEAIQKAERRIKREKKEKEKQQKSQQSND